MSTKEIAELIAQVGFPISFLVAFIYYLAKYVIPRGAAMFEKLLEDFKNEMECERKYHAENLNRFFDVEGNHHSVVCNLVKDESSKIINRIDEKCGRNS